MSSKPGYIVVAYEQEEPVCEVGTAGTALGAMEATPFARELREEFPDAVIAILPAT